MNQHSSSSDPHFDAPSQIGQYEVTGRIGRGSFGVVYKGRDPYLKRDVAIKVCTVDGEEFRQRFYREAEIAGKLEHDHVVAVHAFGFADDAPYLVQEFLEGQDLSHLIKQRVAWSGQRKLDILAQIASALAYAHDQGVIHRDVKPANVRVLAVDPEVKVKLMDFGIARLAHDESQLTQKGVTMGTASYLPPEQVKGGDIDHRGDIFAFGVLAYELFTMQRPFRGQTLSALVYQILYKAPKKLDQAWPGCPDELSRWVHKCLQKDPEARYGDFYEVLEALAPVREGAAVGRWPALSAVWLPEDDATRPAAAAQDLVADESPTEADALSSSPAPPPLPSSRARNDRSSEAGGSEGSVLEESLGSQTRGMPPGSAKVDFDATQPVAPQADVAVPQGEPTRSAKAASEGSSGAPDSADEPEAVDAAATRRIASLVLPDSAEGSGTEVPEELRTSAHEISKLVEAGELEAAMSQLEETIHRHRGLTSTAGVTDVLPIPEQAGGDSGATEVDAERPTVEIPRETTDAARARASAPPPLPSQSAASTAASTPATGSTPPPSSGDEPELQRSPQPPGVAEPAGSPAGSASTTGLPRRTKGSGGRGKLLMLGGAFAAAAVLALVLGWWLAKGGGETEPTVAGMPTAPEMPDLPPQTGLVVQSTPWAVVTEVSNADGFVVDLPENATTPLYLPLEPGEYTVIVRYPEGNEEQRCEVQVTAEQSATCVTPFTQPTASDYFKDAGWYR